MPSAIARRHSCFLIHYCVAEEGIRPALSWRDASPRLEDKLPEGYRCGAVEEDMLKVNGLAAGCTSMLAD